MNRSRVSAECLSDLRIDRLLQGELDGAAEASARAHADTCERCAARVRDVEADRDEFRSAPPPLRAPDVAPGLAERWRRWLFPGAALVAAAGVLFLVFLRSPGEELEGTRTKGGAALSYFIKSDGEVRRGGDGDTLRPGDAVRFAYSTPRDAYLLIVSVDGGGVYSVYHPAAGRGELVSGGNEVLLDDSIVLDDVLGPERVHALFCHQSLAASEVRDRILAAGSPTIEGCVVRTVTWSKAAR